jgi:hypothetical protein
MAIGGSRPSPATFQAARSFLNPSKPAVQKARSKPINTTLISADFAEAQGIANAKGMSSYGEVYRNLRETGRYDGNPEPPTTPPQLDYSGKGFSYNVGCVKDAYFSPKASFHQLLVKDASGSIQDKPVKVTSSSQLWSAAGKTKGMISLFIPANPDITMDAVTPPADSALSPSQWEQYAFQFHYNPTSISMTYSGTPPVDVGLMVSNNDPFNLLGQNGSQSTVDFDLVLNRVSDFKYYGTDGRIKSEYRNSSIYSPRMPKDAAEEKEIYNKGTMYDVEFLLSTVIGFKSNTSLRGNTADLGWLTGRPVKLSLGKSLQYVGAIDGFSVNHTMFDVRMVPIFSTVKITMKRVPDFAGLV